MKLPNLEQLLKKSSTVNRLPAHLERAYRKISAGHPEPHSALQMRRYLHCLLPRTSSGEINQKHSDYKHIMTYLAAIHRNTYIL